MINLEAEVAKIQLGTDKTSRATVSLMAEPAQASGIELFGVFVAPLFNPAAAFANQKLADTLFSSFRRYYKKTGQGKFEKAIAEINAEVSATSVVKKESFENFSVCLAERRSDILFASFRGKMAGYLLRDTHWQGLFEAGEEDANKSQTVFSSFTSGKIQHGDILILSNGELLEYASLDKIKSILLSGEEWLKVSQNLAKHLEDSAGLSVSFGVLLIRFIDKNFQPEQTVHFPVTDPPVKDEGESLDQVAQSLNPQTNFLPRIENFFRSTLGKIRIFSKFDFFNKKALPIKSSKFWVLFKNGLWRILALLGLVFGFTKKYLVELFHKFQKASPKQKAVVLSCICLVLVLMVLGLWMSKIRANEQKNTEATWSILSEVENRLNEATSRQIYGDEATARALLTQVTEQLRNLESTKINPEQAEKVSVIKESITSLDKKLNRVVSAGLEKIAVLSNASSLVFNGESVFTVVDGTGSRYSLTEGKTSEIASGMAKVVQSEYIGDKQVLTYDGDGLRVWKSFTEPLAENFYQQVPKSQDFGGMDFFADRSRLYLSDNQNKQIRFFEVDKTGNISKPQVWNKEALPAGKIKSLAVDGSLYFLNDSGLFKYYQGREVGAFTNTVSAYDLAGATGIQVFSSDPIVYILDPKNAKIWMLEKNGKLAGVIQDEIIKNAQDFLILDKNTALLLVQGSLYKVNLQ